MYVINAPTVAAQKIFDRGCVIVRYATNNVSESPYRYFTLPIERILVMYKDMITIMNRDMAIPYATSVYGAPSFGVVIARIDLVEPQPFGNVFATLNFKGTLSYDEVNFALTLSEDVINFIAKQVIDPRLGISTTLACVPTNMAESYISKCNKEELTSMKKSLENGDDIVFDTSKVIPLQEVVKKVKPGYLEDQFTPFKKRDPGFLYDEKAEAEKKKFMEFRKKQMEQNMKAMEMQQQQNAQDNSDDQRIILDPSAFNLP